MKLPANRPVVEIKMHQKLRDIPEVLKSTLPGREVKGLYTVSTL
jgi:hypothetical protein